MTKAGRLSIPLYDKENTPSPLMAALCLTPALPGLRPSSYSQEVHERYFETQKAEQRNKTIDLTGRPATLRRPSDEAKISWLLASTEVQIPS